MIVQAYQTAFHRTGPVKIRPIDIPNEELLEFESVEQMTQLTLNRAFYYGQNDFQPVSGCYSVSVGDVLKLPNGSLHRVLGSGFKQLEEGEDPTALTGQEASRAGRGF